MSQRDKYPPPPPLTTTPGSWITIVWSIIPIQVTREEVRKKNLPCVNGDLDPGIWPWVKVMIWLCDILSRSNLAVRSYGLDRVLGMTLCALWHCPRTWPLVKVMTHAWVMDSNCLEYYQDPTWQWGLLWPGEGFWVCVHCHLGLGDITLGESHDTSLGHGQQLSEI